VALGLALAGQIGLGSRSLPWLAVALLAGGALLLALATARREPPEGPVIEPPSPDAALAPSRDSLVGGRFGWLAMLLVTLIAAAFRVPWLSQLPPGLAADEARLGLDAVNLLKDGWTVQAWSGWPIFHLLTVGSVAALGQTPLAVRLPAVVAGIAYAPALYMLGRQLGGTRLGTVAGLLGAVIFWHVDQTRGAWGYGAWGILCETLGLALLLRAIRRPDAVVMGLAGLAFGLALQVSWAALAALAAGGLLALGVPAAYGASPRRLAAPLAPFLVYFVVAAGPVLIGLCVPDRSLNLSATGPDAPIPGSGLGADLLRLALMFNLRGDPSPLHNLRAEPMLDAVTAALLVLGLGAALARWRVAGAGAILAWLVAAIGVAAVVGTQPQPDSLAALHALTPALLLAGNALTATAGEPRQRHLAHTSVPIDLALVLFAVIIASNAHAIYIRRPADTVAWAAYGGAERMAAREISRLTPTHTIYLADTWIDDPTIRFLARGLTEPKRLDPATTLPFATDTTFAYFSPGSQEVIPEDLERLYEDGEIDRYRSPLDDSLVVVRSFRAPARVVNEVRGVTLRSTSVERSRTNRFTLKAFQLDWPISGEAARPTSLDLFSGLAVRESGAYRLRLDAPAGSSLQVNGVVVAGPGQEVTVTLARGVQRLHVLAPVDTPTRIELKWAPPGTPNLVTIPRDHLYREMRSSIGLLALYRTGTDPAAPTELYQVERYLERQDGPTALPRPYVVDWVGIVDAAKSGTYQFRIDASGPASLWIDEQPVLVDVPPGSGPASIVLPDGNHRIQVRFVDTTAPTRFGLLWAPPGEEFEAIPTERLEPPDAAVDSVRPLAVGDLASLAPLGAPRIKWLASTEGEPRAVTVRPDDGVVLVNAGARQVQRVVGEGRAVEPLPAQIAVPSDVEVGPDGAVWALDAMLGQVVRLDGTGNVDLTLDNRDLGLYRPRGMALAPDGTILIADTGGSRIVRLAPDGAFLASMGPDVGGPERLRQPTDVAVGPDGDLFVVNGEGGALLRLGADGRYETHWSVLASNTERGAHLAIGADRSLWVTEPEGRRVSRYTFDGTPAGVVDQTSSGRLLRVPVGVAVGADGTLYVADASLKAIVALTFVR
jgi:streptogramin lyase